MTIARELSSSLGRLAIPPVSFAAQLSSRFSACSEETNETSAFQLISPVVSPTSLGIDLSRCSLSFSLSSLTPRYSTSRGTHLYVFAVSSSNAFHTRQATKLILRSSRITTAQAVSLYASLFEMCGQDLHKLAKVEGEWPSRKEIENPANYFEHSNLVATGEPLQTSQLLLADPSCQLCKRTRWSMSQEESLRLDIEPRQADTRSKSLSFLW
jgi:hypothetical protein